MGTNGKLGDRRQTQGTGDKLGERTPDGRAEQAALAAELALEGETGACTLAREWADGAELADASTWTRVHGQPRTGPEALGLETPLEAYRPFLSYNELVMSQGELLRQRGSVEQVRAFAAGGSARIQR